VTDNLAGNGAIPIPEIGISFEPTVNIESLNGELTWGQSSFPEYKNIHVQFFGFRWNRFQQVHWDHQLGV